MNVEIDRNHPPPRRPPRRVVLVLGLFAAVLLAGCDGLALPPRSPAAVATTTPDAMPTREGTAAYPSEVRDNFLGMCAADGTGFTYCGCTLEFIEARVSIEEFLRQEVRFVMGTPSEEFQNVMADAVVECASEP